MTDEQLLHRQMGHLKHFKCSHCSICVQFIQYQRGRRKYRDGKAERSPNTMVSDIVIIPIGGDQHIYGYNSMDVDSRATYTMTSMNKRETYLSVLKAFATLKIPEVYTADNDFNTDKIKMMLAEKTVTEKFTAPYYSYHAAFIERFNRTQVLMAQKMMVDSQLPMKFVGHALKSATYIENYRAREGGTSRMEKLKGEKIDFVWPAVFGALCFVKRGKQKKESLKGEPAVFLGMAHNFCHNTICISLIKGEKNFSSPIQAHISVCNFDHCTTWFEFAKVEPTPIQDLVFIHMVIDIIADAEEIDEQIERCQGLTNTLASDESSQKENTHLQIISDYDTKALDEPGQDIPKQLRSHNSLTNPSSPQSRPRPSYKEMLQFDVEGLRLSEYEGAEVWEFYVDESKLDLNKTNEKLRNRIASLRELVKREKHVEEKFGDPIIPKNNDTLEKMKEGYWKQKWKYARMLEILTIIAKDTWLVHEADPQREPRIIMGDNGAMLHTFKFQGKYRRCPTQWIFDLKFEKFKGRLVILGNLLEIDDTINKYAPTLRSESDRLITAYAAYHDYMIRVFDIITAFLNALATRQIFIFVPAGFEDLGFDIQSIRSLGLQKNQYGQTEAPANWYTTLSMVLTEKMGFQRCKADPCVFKKGTIVAGVHTDDVKYAGAKEELGVFEDEFKKYFDITPPEECTKYLGVFYKRTEDAIYMSQQPYIEKILRDFDLEDCREAKTPLPSSVPLPEITNIQDPTMVHLPYRELLGCVAQVALKTRPDITSSVHVLQRYSHCYNEVTMKLVRQITAYLKETKSHCLKFTIGKKCEKNERIMVSFPDNPTELVEGPFKTGVSSDSSHGHGRTRETAGFMALFMGAAIMWSSNTHKSSAFSPGEAEYKQLALTTHSAVWYHDMLIFLGLRTQGSLPIQVDNTTAEKIAKRPRGSSKKMNLSDRHYGQFHQYEGDIYVLSYLPTTVMISDMTTKQLAKTALARFRDMVLYKMEFADIKL